YADGRLLRTHGDHPAAVSALAGRADVPLLGLPSRTPELSEGLGEEPSRRRLPQLPAGASPMSPEGLDDAAHCAVEGAIAAPELVAEELAPLLASLTPRSS